MITGEPALRQGARGGLRCGHARRTVPAAHQSRSRRQPGPGRRSARQRRRQGADLAVFPEATQARFGSDLRAVAEPLDGAVRHRAGRAAAGARPGAGSWGIRARAEGRVYNTAVAYSGSGTLVAAYRKIHLFDSLGERESALVAPGSRAGRRGAGRAPGGLCHLLRHPLPRARPGPGGPGAELIAVPTAWAAGLFKEEHWVTLVRARAIENTAWVAAAGQVPDPRPADPGADRGRPEHAGRSDGHRPRRPRAVAAGDRGRAGQRTDRPGEGGAAVPGAPARRPIWPGRGRPGCRARSGGGSRPGGGRPGRDGLPGQWIRACHRTGCCPLSLAV